MKYFIALSAFICAAQFLVAAPSIRIGELKMVRAYAPVASENQLREYLPEGENLKRWHRLASVRVFKKEKDPERYLRRVAEMVRKSGPSARAEFFRNEQKKETVLDFITFAPPGSPEHFAEWSMMRAKLVGGMGLVVYQYALRIYEIDDDSVSVIRSERAKMMAAFVEASFEEAPEPNPAATAQRGQPSVVRRFTRIRNSILARPAGLI